MTTNHLNDTRIRWRCRRGMLELDVILERFFDHHYSHLSMDEQVLFQSLLNCSDQDLLNWLIGDQTPIDAALALMVKKIKS